MVTMHNICCFFLSMYFIFFFFVGYCSFFFFFFFSSRRRHTRCGRDWSSDVCSSDLWIPFAISILGFVIFASSQPAMAWMLKYFVDGLTEGASAQFLGVPLIWGFPLFIILVALYQGIGSYLGNYFIAKVSLGVVHDLRTALFDRSEERRVGGGACV